MPTVTSALKTLADAHELGSQDDICVIGPIHPSGQPYQGAFDVGPGRPELRARDLHPETDIRVLPHCIMGDDSWDAGIVCAPREFEQDWYYSVYMGCTLMVQTFALDILALATRGRMTPLRLWHLAMRQGRSVTDNEGLSDLQSIEYGKITEQWQQSLDEFLGFTEPLLSELEGIGDVEIAKQRLVYDGLLWVWMAPNRFPVSPSEDEQPWWLPDVHPSASRSTIENLPTEVLTCITSFLPIISLLGLAGTSRSLRREILGNDYLASVWIHNSAPWWVPVLTQTAKEDGQSGSLIGGPRACLASEWSARIPLSTNFPTGLGWAYIWRCMRSGSICNRKRIWDVALDIEGVADQADL